MPEAGEWRLSDRLCTDDQTQNPNPCLELLGAEKMAAGFSPLKVSARVLLSCISKFTRRRGWVPRRFPEVPYALMTLWGLAGRL